VYVQVVPLHLLLFAIPADKAASWLPTIKGAPIHWRVREWHDVTILAYRAHLLRQKFGDEQVSLATLLGGRASALLNTQSANTDILRITLNLPEYLLQVDVLEQQLSDSEFDAYVTSCLTDPDKPWAVVGPGNYSADGFLVFKQADNGEPFIVFVSSKQRSSSQHVSPDAITAEMQKDVYQTTRHHVYLYITDQNVKETSLASPYETRGRRQKPDTNQLIVLPPKLHHSFYGPLQSLLEVLKAK
jgi:hypothetical protein